MPFDGFIEKKVLTRKDRLIAAAAAFAAYDPDYQFTAPLKIEFGPEWFVKLRSTKGTVLQPIVDGLNNVGVKTRPTIGSVMQSLGLTRADLHDMFCSCHHESISATDAIFFLRYEADLIHD